MKCMGFKCTVCSLIPKMEDFRKRVFRKTQAIVKRDKRVLELGLNVEYLQAKELREASRELMQRNELLASELFIVNNKLVSSSLSKSYLSNKLKNVIFEQKLSEVADFFKQAYESGVLSGRLTLLNFPIDIGKNLLSITKCEGRGKGNNI